MPTVEQGFSHRINPDGSIDAVCHICFRTIATATSFADLASMEDAHKCNPAEALRSKLLSEEAELNS